MRRLIENHALNLAALVLLVVVGLAVGGYILSNQRLYLPSWVPFIGSDFVRYKAMLPSAQSITPGQGQTVNVAGVPVGEITDVRLVDGRAEISMDIRRRYTPIYRDATALVRPRTGLNDMLIELAPGSKGAGVRPPREPIPVSRTLSNVNLDEILAALDKDTRTYLQLLVAGGGQALGGNGRELSATLKRFEPTGVLLRQVTEKVAERRDNVARAVRSFRLLTESLAGKDEDLAELVDSSNAVFAAFAREEDRLRETLRELPPALRSTTDAMTRVDALARELGPALGDLRPAARDLGPALRESQPFLRETTPVVERQLRPFARETLPVVRSLRPAARDLAQVTPDLTRSFGVVNSLLNTLAYDKPRDGHDSYLFWLGWANHLGNALFATQDANGPIRKGVVQVSCASLGVLENLQRVNEQLGVLVGLLNAPTVPEVCPALAAASSPAGAAPAAPASPPQATAASSRGGGG